jgi:NADH-quinone oxidoreductase subunit N
MTAADLPILLPFLVLASASVIVMMTIAFYRSHGLTFALTLTGIGVAFVALFPVASFAPREVTPLFVIDRYALFYLGLILAASFAVTILSYFYLGKQEGNLEEYYLLLLLASMGSSVLVASRHFASFFLGIETLSISLYGLIAYLRATDRGVEAGIKYLILAAVSSAFLLFGMAMVYAKLGTMEFIEIASRASLASGGDIVFLSGTAMIIIGIGFKLAVVPFHMWTPDVYEGAPAPVTAFIATVSKGAVFALLFRYFAAGHPEDGSIFILFTVIAMASMLVGNVLALFQNNVKRILAYSSIAHLGYLLVALQAGGSMAASAVAFYFVAYFLTTLGAFGVISVLSGKEEEVEMIADYQGLAWKRPWLAGFFTVMLFSLAGLPLTAGFIGKFYIAAAGVGSSLWVLVLTLIAGSTIGLFYYLRIIIAMFSSPAAEESPLVAQRLPLPATFLLAVLIFLLVLFGIFPSSLIHIIQTTAALLL